MARGARAAGLLVLVLGVVLGPERALGAEDEDDLPPTETSTAAQQAAQPPPWKPYNLFSLLEADDLRAELERRHLDGGSFPALVERVTRGLVAAPYLLSPLGEGEAPDPDPRFRLDAFDCTTLVETALALALCDELDDAERLLDRIRYREGRAHFQKRRHLMTSQWIPDLIREGLVEDITERVGGKKTKWLALEMSPKRWQRRRVAKSLALEEEAIPRGTFRLPYIPIADLLERIGDVPPATIINVVRQDVPSSPDVITHQGVVILRPGEKQRLVRHASPVSKRVIDEALSRMLWRYTKPGRKWPIIGLNLLRMVDPRTASEAAPSKPPEPPKKLRKKKKKKKDKKKKRSRDGRR